MLIKGIRSFSPDNQNVIEFYRPLTLIVGHNGAGKTVRWGARMTRRAPLPFCRGPAKSLPDRPQHNCSPPAHHPIPYLFSCAQTIIECLKMATTGDLPPNTRSGQSFIHDPKVGARGGHSFEGLQGGCLREAGAGGEAVLLQGVLAAGCRWLLEVAGGVRGACGSSGRRRAGSGSEHCGSPRRLRTPSLHPTTPDRWRARRRSRRRLSCGSSPRTGSPWSSYARSS